MNGGSWIRSVATLTPNLKITTSGKFVCLSNTSKKPQKRNITLFKRQSATESRSLKLSRKFCNFLCSCMNMRCVFGQNGTKEIPCLISVSFFSIGFLSSPCPCDFSVDVSGCGVGVNPELGLVNGSSSSSSSGGSLKDKSSSSFPSPPLDVKLKSRLPSVDQKLRCHK